MKSCPRLASVLSHVCICALAMALLAPVVCASGPTGIVDFWGGAGENIALRSDGTVWTWGWASAGVLGNGHGVAMLDPDMQYNELVPFEVLGPGGVGHLTGIVAIAGGERHNVALDSAGEVWAWGWNGFGQLGNGFTVDLDVNATDSMCTTPMKIPSFTSVRAIATRGYHTLALKNDGTVWAWGYNASGRLGDGTTTDRHSPTQVVGLTGHGGVVSISGGGKVNAALMADHTLMTWGFNGYGAIGNGTTSSGGQLTPTSVSQSTGLTDVRAISVGWTHMVALDSAGTVWTWGQGSWGELGNGAYGNSSLPFHVPGLTNIVGVSAGDSSTVALDSDGTVWVWGAIRHGDGTSYSYGPTPVQVAGIDHVTLLRDRNYQILALKEDGTVWCWGSNQYGECGNGSMGGNTDAPGLVLFPDLPASQLTVITSTLYGGQTGAYYSQAVYTEGGVPPYAWSVSGGALPAGLSIDSSSGVITGTPAAAGTATFTVQVTDNESPAQTATKALSIAVTSVSGPTYQYAASDSETSTTSTNYVGKAAVSFTPPLADDWIIFGFCEFKCPNPAYATFVQLFVDGTGEGQNTRKPVDPTDYLPFITVKVKNLTAGPHSIQLKYRAGNASAAAYVRNARICAVKKAALEFYNVAYDGAKALTVNSTDVAVLTWTPGTTGNYLVISTGEINASTTVSTDLQTLYNGVLNDEGIMRAADNGDYTTFMSFNYCANAPAGVPITHKITGRKMATDPINHYIRRARILALRLSNGRFNNTAAGYATEQNTTQTTWQQCLATTWTYGVSGNWLFLNSARVNNSSTSYQTEVRAQFNNTATCGQQLMRPKDASDLLNYSSIDIRSLTTPRTVDMDWRTTNAIGNAKVKRLRFYGLPLDAQ